MRGIGIALPPACLLNEQTLLAAFAQLKKARVIWLQVHLVSLISAPTMRLFLSSLQNMGIHLVTHLEDVDDLISIPRALNECSAWRYSVIHLPKISTAVDALEWCAGRLSIRGVRLLIENDDEADEADRFMLTLSAALSLGLCFDVGHDVLASTGISECDAFVRRIQLIHLHGIDLRDGTSHLEPWTEGVVREDILARVIAVRPNVPVILEIRDLDIEALPQIVEHVDRRLDALDRRSEGPELWR